MFDEFKSLMDSVGGELGSSENGHPPGTLRQALTSLRLKQQTRNTKAIAIAEALLERIRATGERREVALLRPDRESALLEPIHAASEPLGLKDAFDIAAKVDGDHGDALLAIERLAQTGVIRRVFLDVTKVPPVPVSWDEVLARLGGQEGLAGEAWREAARGISVQWLPTGWRRT